MSKFSVKRAILFALVFFGLSSVPLFAQGDRGVINGRVTDKEGGGIPSADVQAINEATNVVLKTKSDGAGGYVFPSVIPGKYTIMVAMSGFSGFREDHVQVDLGTPKQIDVTMKVGNVDTTVTVNGQSQLLNYDSADLGIVIEEKSMTDLPLIYGNAFTLENLAPGVTLSGVNPNIHVYDSGTANVSINGSMYNSIDYKLDGAADNRIRATAFTPNTESISQYRLATSSYDASQGHASGGFTNVQVKSGTDRYHGSVFVYYQNPNINANNWTLQPTTQVKPQFLREGFSFGGPILKGKLFFFTGFEHSSQTNPNNGVDNVPTQAQIAGDFSALYALDSTSNVSNVCGSTPAVINVTPNAYQLFDPRTSNGSLQRNCIPGNNVAKYLGGIDPVAANVLKFYPAANGGSAAIGTYAFGVPNSDQYTGAVARLDYAINPQQQMYMHLVRSSRFSTPGEVFAPVSTSYLDYENYGVALGHTVALSSTVVLSTVLGYTRFTDYNYNPSEGKVSPTTIGMPAYLVNGLPHSANQYPRFDLTQYTSINQSSDFFNTDDVWLGNVSLSKQLAKHFLRAGVEYRRYITAGQGGGTENGDYSSSGNDATQAYGTNASALAGGGAGFSIAELEMGILTGGTQNQNSDYLTRSDYYSAYFQDDWRASRQLTLNLGLRWEHETPMEELNGKEIVSFNFDAVNETTQAAAASYISSGEGAYVSSTASSGLVGGPATITPTGGAIFANTDGHGLAAYQAPKWDFSPRVGFAYAISPKTVIRGGFGMFFDSILLYDISGSNSGSTTTITLPQQGYSSTSTVIGPAYGANSVQISSTLDNPFPAGLSPATGNTAGVNTAIGQDIQFLPPHPHTPYNERWSFGLQQQFGQFVVQANYVGNHGVHTPTVQAQAGLNYGGRDFNGVPTQYYSTVQGGYDLNENGIMGTQLASPFANLYTGTSSYLGTSSVAIGLPQLLRPRPEFGRINAYSFDGQAIYHSVQLQVQRRFTKGFSTTQAFTWSKSLDATTFLNPGDAKPWYGISASDRPLRYSTSVIYQLPWGRDRRWLSHNHGIVSQIVGGWQVQGVYQIQSGAPLNMGNDVYYGANVDDSHWSRAQYKSTQVLQTSSKNAQGGFWFNPSNWLVGTSAAGPLGVHPSGLIPNSHLIASPAAPSSTGAGNPLCPFAKYVSGTPSTYFCSTEEPGAYQLRTAPIRYSHLRADHLNQADVGLQREFQVSKLGTLQLRMEAVNVLNHPVYSAPSTDPTNSLFDQITTQANASRVFQFAGFFRF